MSAYPLMGHGAGRIAPEKLKMAAVGKNRHYEWGRGSLRHWRETATACDMQSEFDAIVGELLENVPKALDAATSGLAGDFPDAVAGPIVDGVQSTAMKLHDELRSARRGT